MTKFWFLVVLTVVGIAAAPPAGLNAQESTPAFDGPPITDDGPGIGGPLDMDGTASAGAGDGSETGDIIKDDEEVIANTLEQMPPEIATQARQVRTEFKASGVRLADEMGQLREMYLKYHNGIEDGPDAAKRYRAKRLEVRDVMREHFEISLAMFRFFPSAEAASYLVTMLQNQLETDTYDAETFEASTRLIDVGQRYAYLFLAAARSGVAIGKFDATRQIYEVLEEEHLKETDKRMAVALDEIEKQTLRDRELNENVDHEALPQVKLETTQGDVLIELYPDSAPSAVAHFIKLVDQGFYDGLDFGQVMGGLLALSGDASNDGRGNSGQFLIDEHERENARPAMRGSVILAKMPLAAGEFIPNSGSSQFAITYLPLPNVVYTQTVFGRVIDGMDAICGLRRVDPTEEKPKNKAQLPPDAIIRAEVVRRGPELPEPNYVDLKAEFEKARAAGLLQPPNN